VKGDAPSSVDRTSAKNIPGRAAAAIFHLQPFVSARRGAGQKRYELLVKGALDRRTSTNKYYWASRCVQAARRMQPPPLVVAGAAGASIMSAGPGARILLFH
jgi:hypothetical protein